LQRRCYFTDFKTRKGTHQMATYYPLAVGNSWTYKMKDGNTFTNAVTATDGSSFSMKNSMQEEPKSVRIEGDAYLTDNFEAGNFQVLLKDSLKPGDKWEIKYKANNFDNILFMTVKEAGISKVVENQTYQNVIVLEGDLKMNMNGSLMSVNYLVQYYYAAGIGLILTTSSYGDTMGLVEYKLN
jgi:hypothetical protein